MTIPHLDDAVRARIRRRAETIRRRRRRVVATGVALSLALAGVAVGAITAGESGSHRQLVVGSSCPASITGLLVRSGQRATFTAIPRGWVVSGDGTHLNELPLTAAPPAATTVGPTSGSSGQTPNIRLSETPALMGGPVSGTKVHVGSVTGREVFVAADEGSPSHAEVTWTAAPSVQLSLGGTAIPAAVLLAVAQGIRFQPGLLKPVPTVARASISASEAKHALPSDLRRRATAALSAWLEIDHVRAHGVGSGELAPGADDRAAWLVSSPVATGSKTWAVVDASTGKVLEGPITGNAPWVAAVTDRSAAGCEPPLGVLTRAEVSQIIYNAPVAPAGTTLALLDQSDFNAAVHNTISSPASTCDGGCDPLVWVSRSVRQLASYDAITAEPEFSESGGTGIASMPAGDLDPGPTPTAPATTTATGAPPPSSTTTTYPIVGPSPFLPGTMDPKPAPEGNGHGPQGSCDGTETAPPCGPGAQLHRYYAYTLAQRCDQDVRFDGRNWRQELLPPTNGGYETVWMVLNSPTSAGWVGPGAVGMQPAPSSPPTCPETSPAIPPLSTPTT